MGNFVDQLQKVVAEKIKQKAQAREKEMSPESIRRQLEKALWKAAQAGRCGITVGTSQCSGADVRLLTHLLSYVRQLTEAAVREIDDKLRVEVHRSTSVYVCFTPPKENL